jgi:hypothetical protein
MRQNTKTIVGAINAGTATVSTLTAEFDTRGFSFAKIICLSSSTGTLAANVSNNKVEEGDTTSSYATFAGYLQGTDWNGSATTNGTDTAKMIYAVDLRGRKRYLKVTFTHTTGGGGTILAELSNPADGVSDNTSAGAANSIGL